jgi:tRNA-2-methylthio-N6-dimethylallyladenosine synthase
VLSRLGELRILKEKNPGMRIAVAGCVAQAEGRRLIDAAPQIDVLLGPGKIDELPRLLRENAASKKSEYAVGFKKVDHDHDHDHDHERERGAPPGLSGKNEVSRYVNIQQGCNNYCTFCVVPFTRGREVSRTPAAILTECRQLLATGARELTVLGQNVNSSGLDLAGAGEAPFLDLLREVCALPGLARLRFTTSNPQNFTPELAALFAAEPKLGKYIHLPVQAGNDRTLERMKRKVTAAEYRERLAWLRAAVPDMAVSTDLIVGFPGETEAEFEDTLALVAEARFSFSFTFKYSPRKNTPAIRYGDQVPEAVKEARLARLNELQERITIEENAKEVGQTRDVLFLYQNKRYPTQYYGRTEHFRLVRVDLGDAARDIVGQVLPAKIHDSTKTALIGTLA